MKKFYSEAWSRRDRKDPRKGKSDSEAIVGKEGAYFLKYKVHYSCDCNGELPTAYLARQANENKKRHFKKIASKAKERFTNVIWHVTDSQYVAKG